MEKNIVAGIDPGKTGAIAFLRVSGMKIIDIVDYDENDVVDAMKEFDPSFVVLERVASRPKQGVVSVFSFGENFGFWRGVLKALKIPFDFATPQTWMKGQVSSTDHANKKKRSISVCRRLYPGSEFFTREKDHGRADAVLIARYAIGRMTWK